jgi:asparagine synthase (glutamine-hydrolysing)
MIEELEILKQELRKRIKHAIFKYDCDSILLSGGLDTSVLAYYLKEKIRDAFTAIFKENPGRDFMYSKLISKYFNFNHHLVFFDLNAVVESLYDVIRILKTFDSMELRNSVVIYFILKECKNNGFKKIVTGDGGDELFAGYSYMHKMTYEEMDNYIRYLSQNWFFSAKYLGEYLNVEVIQPYLDNDFVNFALSIHPKFKVKEENGKLYGKWIVRKAFEELLPKEIVWREKDPIEVGSGSTALSNLLSNLIQEKEFLEILKEVKIRDKEHAFYYKIYKEVIGKIPEPKKDERPCLYCGAGVKFNTKYCKVCGAYPA